MRRGFDFLGYHFGPDGITVAQKTIERFVARAIRLYEQERERLQDASPLEMYVKRWLRWAGAGLVRSPQPLMNAVL